jgi:hypothetical protein
MELEKVKLTPSEVDAMMPPGEMVHTFMQAGNGPLLGADWERRAILSAAEMGGAELAGESATAMKHGIVVWTKSGGRDVPLFVASLPRPEGLPNDQVVATAPPTPIAE